MKNLNEVARMQQLAGILKENFEEESYYVVDKQQNDNWLIQLDKNQGQEYNYSNRPWANEFQTEEEAIEYAEANNPESLEIETPDGPVLQYENGNWIVAFT